MEPIKTEPIKQEIINNIFENGDKLITGPILQTVLIDMIDDVNVKDQEILSKTGSWDNAVTQIPNLATKAELTQAKDGLQGNITNLSESVARDLANVDLTGYATETWVESQGYLKEHQDISGLATKTELTQAENNLQGNITNLSESVARDLANVPEGVATEAWVQSQDYASKSYVNDAVSSSSVDLTGYATETWVQNQGYLKEHQDISGLATKSELTSVSESVQTDISNLATKGELNEAKNTIQADMITLSGSMAKSIEDSTAAVVTEIQNQDYASKTYVNDAVASSSVDLTGYATKTELTSVSESVQTDITNLSESVANSAVWKKGTGKDSIVQILTDETYPPKASGTGSIATGRSTKASGSYSHAEGYYTNASGKASHAESYFTETKGDYSHAEGYFANASGSYSHAEGNYTTASGNSSHAEGYSTVASRSYSHAEGYDTNASGQASHAEGIKTTAEGNYSHAEGCLTSTTNQYEHAQGIANHSSENQIFSVGAGEIDNPYKPDSTSVKTRKNAISVLAVPNSETQVVTASFFVQNVGGYDGTNPIPGTNDLATVISNLPSGGGSPSTPDEVIWKKGTGTDSIVQVWTGEFEAFTPTASGYGAIATGFGTNASGMASHAEGYFATASGNYNHAEGCFTEAKGNYSHAEGYYAKASGEASHAEGLCTTASNDYEHAQGQYNHNSTNQIFSVGAGEKIGETVTKRNAVSILAVPNSETQINTASVFVQNIGGYDGTNPTPGTNDLATVINGLSSSGGSSETLWKKGTGKDSAVLILTGADEANTPTASGLAAVAIGTATKASGPNSHAEGGDTEASGYCSHAEGQFTTASAHCSHAEGHKAEASGNWSHAEGNGTRTLEQCSHAEGNTTLTLGRYSHAEGNYTTASGDNSHAEGDGTEASGNCSHAEGAYTKASGEASHAEGFRTITSNQYEHAQGRYNHNSTNQIFSIGTGNSETDRRNAVSVLEVDNNGSYTSSFFVQNVGGYDGTNPTPGTNDLATVINGMSTGGGTGTSTETWTFTLDTGTTVTKNIVIA